MSSSVPSPQTPPKASPRIQDSIAPKRAYGYQGDPKYAQSTKAVAAKTGKDAVDLAIEDSCNLDAKGGKKPS